MPRRRLCNTRRPLSPRSSICPARIKAQPSSRGKVAKAMPKNICEASRAVLQYSNSPSRSSSELLSKHSVR